jgi:hypothetical protein
MKAQVQGSQHRKCLKVGAERVGAYHMVVVVAQVQMLQRQERHDMGAERAGAGIMGAVSVQD